MPRFAACLALGLVAPVLLTACQPAEECIETIEIIDFKQDTVFGLSASEALTRLGLPDSGPMGYTPEYPAAPELHGVMTQFEMAVAYADGEVRYHDLEVNPDYREPYWGAQDLDAQLGERCPDRIEVDLETRFVTEDGRFDEDAVDGVMTIRRNALFEFEPETEALDISFEAHLPVDELQGSFTRELVQDDLSRLILSWSPGTNQGDGENPNEPAGTLNTEVVSADGSAVGYGIFAWLGTNPFEDDA